MASTGNRGEKEIHPVIKVLRVYWGRRTGFKEIILRIMRFKIDFRK